MTFIRKNGYALLSGMLVILPFIFNYLRGVSFYTAGAPVLGWPEGINMLLMAAGCYFILFRLVLIPSSYRRESLLGDYCFTQKQAWWIFTPLMLTLAVAVLKNISPVVFMNLVDEDGWVENLTVLFLFTGSGLMVANARRLPKRGLLARSDRWPLYMLALFLFVCGQEEISWGQRIFNFETPEGLANINYQHEFNLHNLYNLEYCKLMGVFYYWSAALLLILLPFLHAVSHLPEIWFARWKHIIADRGTLYCAVAFVNLNNSEWNCLYIQAMFFMTLFILMALAYRQSFSYTHFAFLVIFCLSHFIALTGYDMVTVKWYLSEYREAFVAFGYLVYAIELRFRRAIPAAE
jgi:hypothetical protein